MTEEQLASVMADPLPEGMFSPRHEAVIVFARKSTLMQPIDDETWANLTEHCDTRQIMEIIFTVGFDQMISRFHAAVRTDVDESTTQALAPSCPVHLPPTPGR